MSNEKRPARLGRGLSSLMSGSPSPVVPLSPAPRARLATIPDADEQAGEMGSGSGPDEAGGQSSHFSAELASVATLPTPPSDHATAGQSPTHIVLSIALTSISPNPNQPRKLFDAASLEQLAASIRADGLLQPIIVRRKSVEGQYELVAGERRLRAAQIARLESIPAIVRQLTDQQSTEWALIENLQREDLNPMDRAEAFQQLVDRFQMSHDAIAERVGNDRSTISNFLRLLSLHRDVQDLVRNGLLSFGKARALLGLPDFESQRSLAIRAVRENLSTRQIESAVREAAPGDPSAAAPQAGPNSPRAVHLADLQDQIGRQLGTKVKLSQSRKKGAGSLTISFFSNEQFEDLLGKLGVKLEG